MYRCKITVLKREFYKELADEYIPFPDFGPCHMMKEGDVFITSGPFGNSKPEGFCDMAWQAIAYRQQRLLAAVKFLAMTKCMLPVAMTVSDL